MGADSSALLALTALSGMVFTGSTAPAKRINYGPGTLTQQNSLAGVFVRLQEGITVTIPESQICIPVSSRQEQE